MSNVFGSEFWRSLYFVGMGGQATEANANAMFGLFTGFASFSGVLTATGEAIAGGGRKVTIRKFAQVPAYVEWANEPEDEPAPLPVAKKKKLKPAKEAEKVDALLLTAMSAAAPDAKRKDVATLRKAAKRERVTVPDTEAELRAMTIWLYRRAEALRQAQEAAEEDEILILLLAA